MPTTTSDVLARLGIRVLVVACAAIAVIAAALALGGPGTAAAQESSCAVTDLGTLSSDADGVLEASGPLDDGRLRLALPCGQRCPHLSFSNHPGWPGQD